jgi:simple sugar transport system ATP-binding protein
VKANDQRSTVASSKGLTAGNVNSSVDGDRGSRPMLELRNISKRYGGLQALDDVTFWIGHGEIVGLLGDNGAGKSTLVKVMSGVVQPDEGKVFWNGRATSMKNRTESADLGIETIFQDSALVPSMTIARNIFLGRELRGPLGFMRQMEMRRISSEVLSGVVGIEGIDSPDKLVESLSGGQVQAVAIARAVYFKRTLLILDEPTSALAVRATQALFEYLRSLREAGLSSVLVTHNLHDAYRICDRFVVMSHGRVAFEATHDQTSVDELTERVSRATGEKL